MLLRHSYWGYTALFREKTTIFGAPWLKKGPHRRFGGSSVAEMFIFLSNNKNCPLFVKNFFFYLSPPKSYGAPQKNYHIRVLEIFWHHSEILMSPKSNFFTIFARSHMSEILSHAGKRLKVSGMIYNFKIKSKQSNSTPKKLSRM